MDFDTVTSLLQYGGMNGVLIVGVFYMNKYIREKDEIIQKMREDSEKNIMLFVESNKEQNRAISELQQEIKILQVEIHNHRSIIEKH